MALGRVFERRQDEPVHELFLIGQDLADAALVGQQPLLQPLLQLLERRRQVPVRVLQLAPLDDDLVPDLRAARQPRLQLRRPLAVQLLVVAHRVPLSRAVGRRRRHAIGAPRSNPGTPTSTPRLAASTTMAVCESSLARHHPRSNLTRLVLETGHCSQGQFSSRLDPITITYPQWPGMLKVRR